MPLWPIRLLFSIFLICMLLTATQPVYAETDVATVKVGYYENEIFQEGAAPGEIRWGYAYEYYRKLSEYTGWKYEYVYGGYAELYRKLLAGEIDFLAGLAKTETRLGLIGYPELSMGAEAYNMVKHNGDEGITASYDTLNGKRIGVMDGAMVGVLNNFLAQNNIVAEVVTYPDTQSLMSAFDAYEFSAMVAEGDGTYGRGNADVLYSIGSNQFYLCVNINRPDLLNELNRAQAQLSAEEPNYVNSLRMKYFPSSIASQALSLAEKKWIAENSFLRVGYLNNYLPYSDTDNKGNPTGLVRELLPLIMENLGIGNIKVIYTGYDNYDKMVADINEQNIDVAFPVGGGLYFSEENGIYQSLPITSANTELVYKGEYSEQTITKFAVNENNRMQYYYVKMNFPAAEIIMCPTAADCLRAVVDGRATCTNLNGMRASEMVKNREFRGLSLKQLHKQDDRCFGVRIGNEGLLKLLNRSINIIGKDRMENLAYRYAEGLYSYSVWDMLLDNLWLPTLFIILVAGLIVSFLMRKNATSESANKAKTYFLSTMSHEIRTPINAVLGMNELILRESKEKNIISYAQNIAAAGHTLLSLINDVLDFSKIESGRMELVNAPYQLSSLLHDTVTIIEPRAAKKGLSFHVEIDPALPSELRGDVVRIRQIMLNILTNAVKYTPDGDVYFTVKQAQRDDGNLLLNIAVTDTGIGIKEADRQKLFGDFERLDSVKNSNIEGTGLGLAITKRLITLMGGNIDVESTYGSGSTFKVSLPQEVINATPLGEFQLHSPQGQEADAHHAGFIAPTAKVLLVDDNEMNLMVVQGLLKETQMQVTPCKSGQECLDRMAAEHYDVILLDQMMPELDGVETLKRSRKLPDNKCRHTPVIALTANAVQGAREMFLAEGFADYLSKPVSGKKLELMLKKYLPPEKTESVVVAPETVTADATGTVAASAIAANGDDNANGGETTPEQPLLDREVGLEYCNGMAEFYEKMLKMFCDLKDEKKAEIEKEFAAEDWNNYTIHLHALKTTAKTIGCMALSEAAKALEMAGRKWRDEESNERDKEEGVKFIKENHAAAMELYDKTAAATGYL